MHQREAVQEVAQVAASKLKHQHRAGLVADAAPGQENSKQPDHRKLALQHVSAQMAVHAGWPQLESSGEAECAALGAGVDPACSDGCPGQVGVGLPDPNPCLPHSRQSLLSQPTRPALQLPKSTFTPEQVIKKRSAYKQSAALVKWSKVHG